MMSGLPFSDWKDLFDQWRGLRERIAFWQPVVGLPAWMAPAVAIGAVLALAATTGLAIVSLAAFLTALLVAYLLLSSVFGVAVVIEPPARRP
jgi:hypothetical protein